MQKIITELKLTSTGFLEFIVLKMLSNSERQYKTHSAQEMYEDLKKSGYKTPMGSIYPLLSKLRRNSYVITGNEQDDSGFIIKTYCLTEKGTQHLSDLRRDWKRLNQLIASIGSQ